MLFRQHCGGGGIENHQCLTQGANVLGELLVKLILKFFNIVFEERLKMSCSRSI